MSEERSFEEELDACEAIVSKLERGTFGLDEALELFEDAVRRVKALQGRLGDIESRVRHVLEREGLIEERPFESS